MPPLSPMLAKAAPDLPDAPSGTYWFEPKWDGFRCVVFRDHDEVELGSRNDRPLTRYFPELIGPLRDALPPRCVLDGEVVIAGPGGLDFDALQQRIHPAASRINRLSVETPAAFVAFDLLAIDDHSLMDVAQSERRRFLEQRMPGFHTILARAAMRGWPEQPPFEERVADVDEQEEGPLRGHGGGAHRK